MRALTELFTLTGIFASVVLASAECHPGVPDHVNYTFPNALTTGSVHADWVAKYDNCLHDVEALDKPHISPAPNATSFVVYYFDAASRVNPNETVVALLALATDDSLPAWGSNYGLMVKATLIFSFANGTVYNYGIETEAGDEGGVQLQTDGYGSSAKWGKTGVSWSSDEEGKSYSLRIGSDVHRFHGTLNLTYLTPPRYPCAAELGRNTTYELMPGLGYTNQMPDAKASAQFFFGDSTLGTNQTIAFDNGVGFHDHQWSDRPYPAILNTQTSGHAHVGVDDEDGGYSLFWFQATDHSNKTWSSAYVARDGKTLVAQCESSTTDLLKIESRDKSTKVDIKLSGNDVLKLEFFKDLALQNYPGLAGQWSGKATAMVDDVQFHGQGMSWEGNNVPKGGYNSALTARGGGSCGEYCTGLPPYQACEHHELWIGGACNPTVAPVLEVRNFDCGLCVFFEEDKCQGAITYWGGQTVKEVPVSPSKSYYCI